MQFINNKDKIDSRGVEIMSWGVTIAQPHILENLFRVFRITIKEHLKNDNIPLNVKFNNQEFSGEFNLKILERQQKYIFLKLRSTESL